METTHSDLCIVTKPGDGDSYNRPIEKFSSILSPISDTLFLIGGETAVQYVDELDITTINIGDGEYTKFPYLDFIIIQLHICFELYRLRKEVDLIYLHKGAMHLFLPILFVKVLPMKSCAIKLGDFHSNRHLSNRSQAYVRLITTFQWISFQLADAAIVFSERDIESVPNRNTFVAYPNYIDFDNFSKVLDHSERQFDIGYVGRFTDLKGVVPFSRAALAITQRHPNIEVTIVGSGPLYDTVKNIVEDQNRINLTGWVEYNQLPGIYNEIQILFVPSASESLPTVLLEAMGCGTVVVATPVGSIPALIKNGETGFLIDDQSAKTMEEAFGTISQQHDLPAIADRCRDFVTDKYSKSSAQKKFSEITRQIV